MGKPKSVKLYNIAWYFFIFFTGYGFAVFAGQFVISALTLLLGMLFFGLHRDDRKFYVRNLFKNYGFTLASQAMVLFLAFIVMMIQIDALSPLNSEFEITSPTEKALVSMAEFVIMALSMVVIFLFDYFLSFKKSVPDKVKRLILSVWLSVTNGPCLYLLMKGAVLFQMQSF